MTLAMTGIHFRTAPLALREKVSFSSSRVPGLLGRIEELLPGSELALLSTCNRTELYAAGPRIGELKDLLAAVLLEASGVWIDDHSMRLFTLKQDAEAVTHLMAVASSLDSMVVGETEILGQVKRAYTQAIEAKTSGRILHRLFQSALRTAKRVHTETDICRGRVSVSSIAVEFAEGVFDELSSKKVMVVGAGKTTGLTLKNLVKRGVSDIVIVNRSLERGELLAKRYGGRAIQYDLLEEHLSRSDIVISATNAPHCVIHASSVQKAVAARNGTPFLLIDIAVPRDIEERAADLENVYLYNIDDLQKVAAENLARRQNAVADAWNIVRAEAADFVPGQQPRSCLPCGRAC